MFCMFCFLPDLAVVRAMKRSYCHAIKKIGNHPVEKAKKL